MIVYMGDLMKTELGQTKKDFTDYLPMIEMELPEWIK